MTSVAAELCGALYSAILHSVWQGCFLALFYLILSRRLQSSRSRYRLAMSSFLLAATAFIGTFLLAFASMRSGTASLPSAPSVPAASYFAFAWCAGAAFFGGRLFCGWLWLRIVVVRRSVAVPPSIRLMFEDAKTAVGAAGRITVRASASIRSPMVTGVLKPIVLLPVSMLSGVPPNVLHTVFIHELLHVRHLDHIAVFLQAIGETLLFYHPAVRWLSAEARRCREYRCDDESVRELGNRFDYARALISIEEAPGDPLVPALLMNGDDMMNRVERLLCDDKNTGAAKLHFSGLVAFACLALLMHSLSYGNDEKKQASEFQRNDAAISIAWLPPAVTQYSSVIEDAAARHGVSADVLALMLLVESHGDVQATSSSGARGLMQVMPKTGQAIAEQRGIADFDSEQLFDAETNIDFGAWYLAQQMERFADQPERVQELAISAYNAGPRKVADYVSGSQPLPVETAGYRDLLLSMLAEAGKDRSLALEGRKAALRERLPAFRPPVEGHVASRFGAGGGERRVHKGVDIAAPLGTPVVAPVDGQVSAVGEDATRGKYITVRHAYGVESRYYHLSDVSVEVGHPIRAGEPLGAVGSSGLSTKSHLHFEVRELGQAVSPSLYGLVLE